MSYLIIGGLSPLSLRGVIPQLLNADETKKVVIYDDLSGGSSSSSAAVLSDPRVSQVVVGSTFNEKLLQKTLTDNEITHVIDLASLSSPKETSPIAIARTAVVGFTHVLDAVRHYGGKPRFVLVSREPSSSRPLSESTPPLPNSLVAANAMAVESMLHSYVISYRMPLVVVRLSEGVLAHDLSRGLNAAFSPGAELSDAAFSAISINDAARGILAVLNKGVAPEIYNIGGEMAVTHKAVSEFIEKIKAGSCCTISSNNPSVFPIERAQKELGWAPEEKNLCEVLKSELTVAAAAPGQLHSFTKVLIFGADQPTGKRLLKALEEKFIPVVLGTSHPGEDPIDTVKEEIYRVAPSNIVFVGDRNEDPAYYDQEPKPARLRENVGKNLHAPWILAAICERVRCHFAYVQTYKEEDEKQETSEGVVKGFTKRLLEQFTSAYQTRFILSENAVDDVNITAIVERIRDNKSSMNAETEKAGKTCTLS